MLSFPIHLHYTVNVDVLTLLFTFKYQNPKPPPVEGGGGLLQNSIIQIFLRVSNGAGICLWTCVDGHCKNRCPVRSGSPGTTALLRSHPRLEFYSQFYCCHCHNWEIRNPSHFFFFPLISTSLNDKSHMSIRFLPNIFSASMNVTYIFLLYINMVSCAIWFLNNEILLYLFIMYYFNMLLNSPVSPQ